MNNIDTPLRSRIEALSEVVFKPTFTFFDNTLLINYKKTGSRFFQILCKAPIGNPYEDRPDGDKFSTQIDAEFKLIKNFKTDYNILNLKNVNYLVDFKFDDRRARAIDDRRDIIKWNTYSDILTAGNSTTITEMLRNPNKKITFVIKNPIDRFLSGIIQILRTYISESLKDEFERDRLKRHTGLSDSDIRYIWKCSHTFFSEDFHHKLRLNHDTMEGIDKFVIICTYLLENRFDLILQNIHTEPYLDSMKFLIDGIENDNYQIIDIGQCTTTKAYKLFDEFSNTIKYSKYYDVLTTNKFSNKHIYDFLYDLYDGPYDKLNAVPHFLKKENAYYEMLRTSKHFVSLEDSKI